ncbi:hypothetical protein ACFWIA_12865 [Streptomyces sp. NPDC127068]|uniref:hypothetical protein n=1 Tax=Streptomyces sp. NPDC127068 TaxID=3347127 RepID=UPI0036673826
MTGFCRDGIDPIHYAEYIEPMCRAYAVPYLISMADLREDLGAVGFEILKVENQDQHGDLEPTWELFDRKARSRRERTAATLADKVLVESHEALARAGRAGHFVLGFWQARCPATPATWTEL